MENDCTDSSDLKVAKIVVTDDNVTINGEEMKNPPFLFKLMQVVSKMSKKCAREKCEKVFTYGGYTPAGYLCSDCESCFIESFDDIIVETREFFEKELNRFLLTDPTEKYVVERTGAKTEIIDIYQFLTHPDDNSWVSDSSEDSSENSEDSDNSDSGEDSDDSSDSLRDEK